MRSLDESEPIAIVGMACRLPGEVRSPSQLWDLLVQERCTQSDVPPSRFNVDAWYHPNKSRPGSVNTKGGHFLSQDDSFRQFDPSFFGIKPKEAASMDPQQRKLLEVVYESFEAAGARLEDVSGTNTACYVGNFTWDIGQMQARDVDHGAPHHMTGGGLTILSNRVNYVFNLKGPSMTIDTACSSTMYALHMACRSLQAGDCSAAVVAGTNLIFGIEQHIASVRLGVLSPTSVCHTFDESADGYARAEAVGALYLKPLSQAIANKDPIRAVIRGTSINANGRSSGISHPSAANQELVIRQAYATANLGFEQTGYFECHGTGTPVGDPLEIAAIGNVFGDVRTPECPLLLGSMKTNLGHGEAASAISSMIKTVLCLENEQIPATIGITRLNPALDLRNGRLKVVQSLSPWPTTQSYLRASINSFGYGGANAHAILDSTQSYLGKQYQRIPTSLKPNLRDRYYLIPFSAHKKDNLMRNIEAFALNQPDRMHLPSLAYTLGSRRSNLSERAFTVMVSDSESVQISEGVITPEKLSFGTATATRSECAFVFTGQGAQWAQMGNALGERYELFRTTLQTLGKALASLPNAPEWELLEELARPQTESRTNEAELSQALTTAIQIGLVDLLQSWGIIPVAVVGHSSGEIAAAYCAGKITAREAIIIAYQRGVATNKTKRRGAMLAVGLSPADVLEIIADIPDIGIACYNAPNSVTLTGSEKAVEEACARFLVSRVFHRKLATSGNAYHSSFMKEAGQHYDILLKQCFPDGFEASGGSKIQMFSSVTEKLIETVDPAYWQQNLESPVRFNTATQLLLKSRPDVRVTVEIGPHSALAGPIKAIRAALELSTERLMYHPTLKRNGNSVECLLNLAESLFLSDYSLSVTKINSDTNSGDAPGILIPDLPTYQWNYDQDILWAESRLSTDIRFRTHPHHDLLGSRLPGTSDIAPTWRNMISVDKVPWLKDHKVGNDIVFPAAGYVAMALEAIAQVYEQQRKGTATSYTLRDVDISSAILLKESSDTEILFDLHAVSNRHGVYGFNISTVSDGVWTEHATGTVQGDEDQSTYERSYCDPTKVGSRGGMNKDSFDRQWYRAMDRVSLKYGASFKTLSSIGADAENSQATADVLCNASEIQMAGQSRYAAHPTTLDACLQLSIIAAFKGRSQDLDKAYLPILIPKLTVWPSRKHSNATLQAFSHGARSGLRSVQAITGLRNSENQSILQAEVSFLSLETATEVVDARKVPQPYTRLVWMPDIDRLTNSQAKALFTNTHAENFSAIARFSSLEHLTRLAIRSVTERLPSSLQIELLPSHMQRFCRWIAKQGNGITHQKFNGSGGARLEDEINSIAQSLEQRVPEAAMVAQLNTYLPQIIGGSMGALDVMLENNLLTRIYEDGIGQIGAYAKLTELMALIAHKNSRMRILELGAGTGGATKIMLDALEGSSNLPRYEKYYFTDVSKAFLGIAHERFKAHRHLEFGILDIENVPADQGFADQSFDIVFASNVIHATRSVASSLRNCKRLLKPDGRLIIVETTKDWLFTGFMLGALPGYWLGAEDGRPDSPFLSKHRWNKMLREAGFNGADILLDDFNEPARCTSLIVAQNTEKGICADLRNDKNGNFGVNEARARGGSCGVSQDPRAVRVKPSTVTLIYRHRPQQIHQTIEREYEKLGINTRSIALEDVPISLERDARTIMLAELEGSLLARMTPEEMSAVQRYTQLANTALWITDGGVIQGQTPEKSLVFGLAKAIMTEQPSFHLCSLDIDAERRDGESDDSAQLIVETEMMFHQKPNAEMDTELVEKDGLVYISRYVSDQTENTNLERHVGFNTTISEIPQGDTAFKLRFEKVGKVESFYFDKHDLKSLAEGEVLIDVDAAPLNSQSAGALVGRISSPIFGSGVAGTVRAVSHDGCRLKPGDYVYCAYPHQLDTAIVVHERSCEVISMHERNADMLGQIHPLVTSLHVAALLRLNHGNNILVDCDQVNLVYALAQVAEIRSSKVFLTCRSHVYLKKLRITGRATLIDRRSALQQPAFENFFEAILTDAEGDFSPLCNTVKPGGHVIAFGRYAPVGMRNVAGLFLRKGATIGIFDPIEDFAKIATQQPEFDYAAGTCSTPDEATQKNTLLADALDLLRRDVFSSGPCERFDLAQLPKAISRLAQDDFVGSAIITRTAATRVPIRTVTSSLTFNPDASYLLVGCLGGLGRSLTAWMVARGARHFIFLSRSGADKPEAAALLEELYELARSQHPDLTVRVIRGDVSIRDDVSRAISSATKPIKGVVQAAMVLKDKLFSEMTLDDFNRVVHPKMLGSMHLHELLLDHDLDFFVMTSSVLGAIGAAMQSNYSAANAYLDHMARHRHSMGLQATSIALGMIVDVGHVEEHPEVEKALKRNGLYGISMDEYLLNMELACRRQNLNNAKGASRSLFKYDPGAAAHIVTGMDYTRLSRAGGKSLWLKDNRLQNVVHGLGEAANEGVSDTEDATRIQTAELLTTARIEGGSATVEALVLKLILERFSGLVLLQTENIDPSRTLSHYGMDSMISAELKSWAWREFKVELPFLGLLDQGLTFTRLANQILGMLE